MSVEAPDAAREQLGRLQRRRLDPLVPRALEDLPRARLEARAHPRLLAEHVERAARSFDLLPAAQLARLPGPPRRAPPARAPRPSPACSTGTRSSPGTGSCRARVRASSCPCAPGRPPSRRGTPSAACRSSAPARSSRRPAGRCGRPSPANSTSPESSARSPVSARVPPALAAAALATDAAAAIAYVTCPGLCPGVNSTSMSSPARLSRSPPCTVWSAS